METSYRSGWRPLPVQWRQKPIVACCIRVVFLVTACLPSLQAADSKNFEIRQGDHISLIGNTLADRMQHDGWFETYFRSGSPSTS